MITNVKVGDKIIAKANKYDIANSATPAIQFGHEYVVGKVHEDYITTTDHPKTRLTVTEFAPVYPQVIASYAEPTKETDTEITVDPKHQRLFQPDLAASTVSSGGTSSFTGMMHGTFKATFNKKRICVQDLINALGTMDKDSEILDIKLDGSIEDTLSVYIDITKTITQQITPNVLYRKFDPSILPDAIPCSTELRKG